MGLRVKDITGDGNCFFRALGDQLQVGAVWVAKRKEHNCLGPAAVVGVALRDWECGHGAVGRTLHGARCRACSGLRCGVVGRRKGCGWGARDWTAVEGCQRRVRGSGAGLQQGWCGRPRDVLRKSMATTGRCGASSRLLA